jgi:hypothetical protein
MGEIKTYMVINSDGEVEFDLIVIKDDKETCYSLFASNNSMWNSDYKGKRLLSMTNDGNGFSFDKKIKDISFDECEHIRIIINFEQMNSTNEADRVKFKIVESSNVIEV